MKCYASALLQQLPFPIPLHYLRGKRQENVEGRRCSCFQFSSLQSVSSRLSDCVPVTPQDVGLLTYLPSPDIGPAKSGTSGGHYLSLASPSPVPMVWLLAEVEVRAMTVRLCAAAPREPPAHSTLLALAVPWQKYYAWHILHAYKWQANKSQQSVTVLQHCLPDS